MNVAAHSSNKMHPLPWTAPALTTSRQDVKGRSPTFKPKKMSHARSKGQPLLVTGSQPVPQNPCSVASIRPAHSPPPGQSPSAVQSAAHARDDKLASGG